MGMAGGQQLSFHLLNRNLACYAQPHLPPHVAHDASHCGCTSVVTMFFFLLSFLNPAHRLPTTCGGSGGMLG